jgi:hypothetical protein
VRSVSPRIAKSPNHVQARILKPLILELAGHVYYRKPLQCGVRDAFDAKDGTSPRRLRRVVSLGSEVDPFLRQGSRANAT